MEKITRTILIVDDSESIRTILKLTLQFKGYKIMEAGDGEEGYKILQKDSCDLLITDLAMPHMSGLELIDKVRGELNLDSLPVIICTAEETPDPGVYIKRGATQVLMKPVSPLDLLKTVETLLSV
ncbi:response regulator [Candidatus Sumerlaeota bacterium]|nr:response regulator [Candidatus Sumerlaeota bacterium]